MGTSSANRKYKILCIGLIILIPIVKVAKFGAVAYIVSKLF